MSNGANETAVPPDTQMHSSWTDHPVAITVAALAGAALLAVGLFVAGAFYGDEPPILVKNGSLELRLMSGADEWEPRSIGNMKEWKIKGNGKRQKDPLDVSISVNAGANCPVTSGTGNTLIVTYSDGTTTLATIDIHSNGKKAWVTSTVDLTPGSVNQVLTYSTAGFISKITLDTTLTCSFTDKNQLAELQIK